MSTSTPPSTTQKKHGPTDYKKWDRFDTKAYGYDSSEEREEDEEERLKRDPRFQKKQQENYLATLAEMDKTKKRIAELQAQQKAAETAVKRSEVDQRWWATWGVSFVLVGVAIAMFVPQLMLHFLN
eukprot:GDKJ01031316.1.p1 GENE.GDKJ01031316.1~~GDKJ01031316.1.p1  ORF type:complete len:126 (+),score=20.42 GDKJ01031316.1:50-427(+)